MYQAVMVGRQKAPIVVLQSGEVDRAEAVASGRAQDRLVFRRLRMGVLVGIGVMVPVTCGLVAAGLLLVGSFAFGPLVAGIWGGLLGGAFLGGIVAIPDLDPGDEVEARGTHPALGETRAIAA